MNNITFTFVVNKEGIVIEGPDVYKDVEYIKVVEDVEKFWHVKATHVTTHSSGNKSIIFYVEDRYRR